MKSPLNQNRKDALRGELELIENAITQVKTAMEENKVIDLQDINVIDRHTESFLKHYWRWEGNIL